MTPATTVRPDKPLGALASLALFGIVTLAFSTVSTAGETKQGLAAKSSPPAAKTKSGVYRKEASEIPLDAERLFKAVVKVHSRAVPEARSSEALGEEREGSGVVIGADGLVLTIGYLVIEADDVKITDQHGRSVAARIVASDQATGLALLRTVTPIDATPVPLGESAKTAEREPVMVVNNSGVDDVTLAYIVSRRPFTGNWEYMLDQAIFTSPPTLNWSGAALIDHNGRLLGVGSLIVRDALNGSHALPGNMFVPIDALKPVLDELLANGKRSGAARPWLGVSADEQLGRLLVTRVSPESPGEAAGIQVGDIILAVGDEGVRSQAEFYQKIWGRGPAGTEIPLRILQGIDIKEVSVRSIDPVDYFKPQTTF
jgi:S1-C subfamily serine protease